MMATRYMDTLLYKWKDSNMLAYILKIQSYNTTALNTILYLLDEFVHIYLCKQFGYYSTFSIDFSKEGLQLSPMDRLVIIIMHPYYHWYFLMGLLP